MATAADQVDQGATAARGFADKGKIPWPMPLDGLFHDTNDHESNLRRDRHLSQAFRHDLNHHWPEINCDTRGEAFE